MEWVQVARSCREHVRAAVIKIIVGREIQGTGNTACRPGSQGNACNVGSVAGEIGRGGKCLICKIRGINTTTGEIRMGFVDARIYEGDGDICRTGETGEVAGKTGRPNRPNTSVGGC